MLTAIIVAGGSSRRMGLDKTFALLAGQPIIIHAIAAFERAKCVTEIIVVGRAERLPELQELIAARGFKKISRSVAGGPRRQDSVRNGLREISRAAEYVAVHDAARPLVRPQLIEQVFLAAQSHDGAACAASITDTLKRVDDEGLVAGSVERTGLYGVQTPQIFSRELLERAYEKVFERKIEVTDEISAVEEIGGKVILVSNEQTNLKVTFPSDLALAELLLNARPR